MSCQSWQGGFNADWLIDMLMNDGKISGKPAWKTFRKLMIPKWSKGFIDAMERITGTRKFTYVTAVTLLKGKGDPKKKMGAASAISNGAGRQSSKAAYAEGDFRQIEIEPDHNSRKFGDRSDPPIDASSGKG